MLLGPALGGVRHPDVDLWMASKGAAGAAALLDFGGGKYGFRSPTGVPRAGSLASDLTFARASAASFLDASGQVQFAASGQPRMTHDRATLAPLGVVIEGARSNLFSNPTWAGPATAMSWGAFSPEGVAITPSMFGSNVSARRFTATGNRPRLYQSVSLSAGVTYTVSMMIEQITGSAPASWVSGTGVIGNITTTYLACPANPTGGPNSAVRPGLFIWQIVSTVAQAVNFQLGLGIPNVLAGVTADISMPQIEVGVYPTSFIPSGARAAESLFTTLPFDPEAGFTLAMKFKAPLMSVPGAAILMALYNGSSTASLLNIYANSGAAILAGAGSLALTGTSLALGTIAPSSEQRLVMSVSVGGECRVSMNGGATLSRGLASGVIPAGMTRLDLMGLAGTLQAQTTLSRVAVWKGAPFADAEFRGLLS